jgi:hypothetical protein
VPGLKPCPETRTTWPSRTERGTETTGTAWTAGAACLCGAVLGLALTVTPGRAGVAVVVVVPEVLLDEKAWLVVRVVGRGTTVAPVVVVPPGP